MVLLLLLLASLPLLLLLLLVLLLQTLLLPLSWLLPAKWVAQDCAWLEQAVQSALATPQPAVRMQLVQFLAVLSRLLLAVQVLRLLALPA